MISNSWPRCVDHSESPYQFLLLSKKCNSSRILCSECLYSEEKRKCKDDIIDIIPLQIAFKSPGILIDQIKNDSISSFLNRSFQICELDLEKLFNKQIMKFETICKMLSQMKDEIAQKFKDYKVIQEQLTKQRDSFFEKCNFELIKQLINQLKELDKQYKSDQYLQIIAKINSTIDEMLKDDCALISKNAFEIFSSHSQIINSVLNPKFCRSIPQINEIIQGYSNFIDDLNGKINPHYFSFQQSKILTTDYFTTIQQRIEQGSNKYIQQINLIYIGSRDGLNVNSFWDKVNGKGNLLIVFKSSINQVFGGYTPCQWESTSKAKYIRDDTVTSFLFSQTKNEFYPLNQAQKLYAILCNSNYGPWFGQANDMCIINDLTSGNSILGNSYILDEQYKSQSQTHLFGEKSPKIIECEIYELKLS